MMIIRERSTRKNVCSSFNEALEACGENFRTHRGETRRESFNSPSYLPTPPCFVVRNARIRAHVAFRLRLPLSPIRTILAIDRCNRLLSCVTEEDLCALLVTEKVSIRSEKGKKASPFFEKIFLLNDSFDC